MAIVRKRVQAIRRGVDGSAFEKCEECGVKVAIALFDMHECGEKKREVKRFKYTPSVKIDDISKQIERFEDEIRSPFVFFVEEFRESSGMTFVDASRICYDVWRNMTQEQRKRFIARSAEVDLIHYRKLDKEANSIRKVDDEADSKAVGKFNKFKESFDPEEDYDISDDFGHEFQEEDTLQD